MRKCKTCGIISHPHKDFYKCFDKKSGSTVCRYCYPAIRSLRKDGVIPFKENGVKYMQSHTEIIRLKIDANLKSKGKTVTKSLKWRISNRLASYYGKLKCYKCNNWHDRKDQPIFMQNHGSRYCHPCWKDLSLEWVNNNKERANKRTREWVNNNKEKANKRTVDYMKKRLKEDSFFKFKQSVRSLINSSIKYKGYTKKSKTHEILGCDWETFKTHIERQFKKGMTWENRNEWHIDHIYPMKEARTEEDVIRLNHYTNLRPLWAKENLSKNASIEEHQMKLPI